MVLSNLNFDEEPLTREDLLKIKGGSTAAYTLTTCTGCTKDANGVNHCTDGCKED